MNPFDFFVKVALGSILARTLLSKDASLPQGATAFGVLIAMQFIVTWLSARFDSVRETIFGEPQILFYQGCYLDRALRSARVIQDHVLASIRAAGHSDLAAIRAVVIETDASFMVITDTDTDVPRAALLAVKGREHLPAAPK